MSAFPSRRPSALSGISGAILLIAFFAACSKNPFENDKSKAADDKQDTAFVLAQGGLVQGTAKEAADLHQDASAEDRVQERLQASEPPPVKPEVGVKTIGAPKGDPILSKNGQVKNLAAGALLKRSAAGGTFTMSAIAEASGAAEDTARWFLSDSSQGYVYSLKSFAFLDSSAAGAPRAGEGVDSVRYRWPHSAANPLVLSFDRRRAYADGWLEVSAVLDDDGDGILSEAKVGKTVRLKRTWLRSRGDTAWTRILLTDHGQTTHFDSLGAGKALSWSDSLSVGGKMAWWRRIYDADGDGLVASAVAGGKVKVGSDDFVDLGGGLSRYGTEIHGPGPDKDYARESDNERYSAFAWTVNGVGEDMNRIQAGDADGDGLLWSQEPGAANRAWETSAWAVRGDLKSYRDSLVRILGARDGEGRIAFFSSSAARADGTVMRISVSPAAGASSFGPADTARLAESLAFPASDAEGRDSTVRTASLIPGRLDAEDDDKLIAWSSTTYYRSDRADQALARRSESFAAAAPMAPGTLAAAGSWQSEEQYRVEGQTLPATVRKRHDFDKATGASAWKEIRIAPAGDSSVTSGGRSSAAGAAYASWSLPGVQGSGSYHPATGDFRDTVAWTDAKGKPAGRRTMEGRLKEGAGEYAASVTRADGRIRSVQVKAVNGADGWRRVTVTSAGGATSWKAKGDSVSMEKEIGKALVAFTMARKPAGGYGLRIIARGAAQAEVLRGALDFGTEGSGDGELTEVKDGKAQDPVRFRSEADGSVLLDGKKLP